MFKYLLLLLLLDESFVLGIRAPKIVNGTNAVEGEIPYMVALLWGDIADIGGTILDEYHVLTAAHAVTGLKPSFIQYGVLQLNSTDNIIAVEKATIHPDYVPGGSYINDIAILKLVSPITFSDTVKPVALPPQGYLVADWSEAVVAGWGAPFSGGGMVNDLQRADILVFPEDECEAVHSGLTSRQYHICAGIPEGGRGPCSSDSGGPLTVDGFQVGIVSWFIRPCSASGVPDVFVKVSNYINWINGEIQF